MAKRSATKTEELRELTQLSDVEINDLAAKYHLDVVNPETGEAYTRDELIEAVASKKKQSERKAEKDE